MAKESAPVVAPAPAAKLWKVEWEVYMAKDKEPMVRRKYYSSEVAAKKFAEKLREAIDLVGCSNSSPSYSAVEVEE